MKMRQVLTALVFISLNAVLIAQAPTAQRECKKFEISGFPESVSGTTLSVNGPVSKYGRFRMFLDDTEVTADLATYDDRTGELQLSGNFRMKFRAR